MKPIIDIIKITGKFWKYYLAVSVFIVVIAALNLVNPILNKNIVDIIVNNNNGKPDLKLLIILLALIFLSDVIITLLTNIAGYLGDLLGAVLKTHLMQKFYDHILRLEIEYFDNEQTGKIVSKLQRGIQNITDFINSAVNNFLPFFLTAIFTVGFLAFYSWEIAVLLAILFPIYIVISDRSSKRWIKKQGVINTYNDKQFGRANEVVSSIRVVKSFINERLESKFFRKQREEIEKITKVQSREYHRFDTFRRFILNVILFLIYAYIIYYTYTRRYSIGEMTLLLQLVNQARFPLFAMSFILAQIQQASAGSKDFFDVIAQPIKIKDKKNARKLKNVKGDISFHDINFKYNTETKSNVLNGISFHLDHGKKLAIVGMSGEGKSTLTNLLLRFYEPQSGDISIDSINIQDVTQNSLHKNIGVVLQESILFSGTLMENIKYGNPKATDEQIISAAKSANAHEFIKKFEKGYDTEIGERGIKLSGGQKQRISIARAILKDAPILILDEATSSLDSKAEHEVQLALENLMHDRTTIIIAHRLSTIRNVDQIIVLEGGTIAEQGSPSSLSKTDGIYAELLRLQNLAPDKQKENKRLKEFEISA